MKQNILLIFSLLLISCNNSSINYEELWESKMDAKDFKGALVTINSAIKNDSLNADLYRKKGNSYFSMNDYKNADSNYSLALKLDSTNIKTLLCKAMLLSKQENINEALNYIEQAEQSDSSNANIYLSRGNIYAKEENYSEAEKEFRKAIFLDAELSEAYNNLANILAIKGEFEDAISVYTKALINNPNKGKVFLHRGITKLQLDRIDDALVDINNSIRLNKDNNPMAYWQRASIYQKRNEFSKAIVDYTVYAKLKPIDYMVYNNRAGCYIELEKYNEAIKDFSKAIDIDNTQSLFYESRGYAKGLKGDNYGACLDYKKAKKLGSANADEVINILCN